MGVDPLAEKYPAHSPYNYTLNNPLIFIDDDGREPVKKYAGKASTFINVLNNTPSKVGQQKGAAAEKALIYLGSTEWKWSKMKSLPTATPYFNNRPGRYIYTTGGGWVDMVHFLFYAGKAYKYKQEGEKNPIGEAVQDGFIQEALDGKNSKYSYEDLPSDKLGAIFAITHFNPNSSLTFAEQLLIFLNNLGATDPTKAPNYKNLPYNHHKNKPTYTNQTTSPMFITGTGSNAKDEDGLYTAETQ